MPPPRLRHFDYTGCRRYALTLCTFKRRALFTTAAAVDSLRTQLLHTASREGFAILVYCFMPDHVHILVEGSTGEADLRRFVRLFKQCSSYGWKRRTGEPLWQRGYFERVLRREEDTATVARYILANPVRGGLVTSPLDYPLVGSGTMDVHDLLAST